MNIDTGKYVTRSPVRPFRSVGAIWNPARKKRNAVLVVKGSARATFVGRRGELQKIPARRKHPGQTTKTGIDPGRVSDRRIDTTARYVGRAAAMIA